MVLDRSTRDCGNFEKRPQRDRTLSGNSLRFLLFHRCTVRFVNHRAQAIAVLDDRFLCGERQPISSTNAASALVSLRAIKGQFGQQ